MESSFPNGGFEDFLQGKADQYKLYPSDKVWENINARLHPRTNWSYLIVAALFLGLGIGGKLSDSRFAREPQTAFNTENAASMMESTTASTPVIPISSYSKRIESKQNRRSVDGPATVVPLFESIPVQPADAVSAPGPDQDINESSAEPPVATTETATVAAPEWNQEFETEGIINQQASTTSEESPATSEENLDAGTNTHKPSLMSAPLARQNSITALPSAAPEKASAIKVLKPKRLNTGWQVYFGPSVSYRKLQGDGIRYFNAILGYSYSPDVNKSVTHKPDIGFEVGGALTFGISRMVRFKTGLQVNVNQYDIMAYHSTPEMAPLSPGGLGHTGISAVSRYRNFNGFSKTWLKNQHIMLSLPIGAEVVLFGNNRVQFQVAGTLQPTYVLNNQAYMISTNMKNYAQEPSLYNRFNVAAGAEAYFTIKAGSYKWMIGPQVRYQLFSSYKQAYPITEHLTDYGFKIGIMK